MWQVKSGTSRIHYIEFKYCIKNDENIKPITVALPSDNFNDFYPYFIMKKQINKKISNSIQVLVFRKKIWSLSLSHNNINLKLPYANQCL